MKNIEVKRIRWLCRRGMLELDKLLFPFCENNFVNLSYEKKMLFIEILRMDDNILYNILVKNMHCPEHLLSMVLEIKNFYKKSKFTHNKH